MSKSFEQDKPSNFSRPFRRLSSWVSPADRQDTWEERLHGSPTVLAEAVEWSMVHGFYAGMGGFVYDIDDASSDENPRFLPESCRLTLTARAVVLLCRCGLLPRIRQREILDKSKSDGLAKALACLQAGWMVAQVIARLHYGLPITLLEVNTLGHVFCAFVIYVLWWNKPKYIKEPTKLEGEWIKSIMAFMYMSSKLSGQKIGKTGHLKNFTITSELSALAYIPENVHTGLDAHFVPKPQQGMDNMDLDKTASLELAEVYASVQNPTSVQLERWRLGAQAVKKYPAIRAQFTVSLYPRARKDSEALRLYPEMPTNFRQDSEYQVPTVGDWLECPSEQLVTEVAGNWPDDDLLRGVAGLMMGAVLWSASIAFGAVHAAAWECYFPSTAEAWLWRSSACYIIASGLLWLLANLLSQCSQKIWWYWYDMLLYQKHWLHYFGWGLVFTIFGIAYIFARLFLVVEAFLSLRSLPVGAYNTPQWTDVIPHL